MQGQNQGTIGLFLNLLTAMPEALPHQMGYGDVESNPNQERILSHQAKGVTGQMLDRKIFRQLKTLFTDGDRLDTIDQKQP